MPTFLHTNVAFLTGSDLDLTFSNSNSIVAQWEVRKIVHLGNNHHIPITFHICISSCTRINGFISRKKLVGSVTHLKHEPNLALIHNSFHLEIQSAQTNVQTSNTFLQEVCAVSCWMNFSTSFN